MEPRGWNGPWNVNNVPWQPCHILLVPGIPSRHRSQRKNSVVLAYIPTGQPAWQNPLGFSNPALGRLLMWICGPRTLTGCTPGARTCSPCAHVVAAIHLAGVLAHNPMEFKVSNLTTYNYSGAWLGFIFGEYMSISLLSYPFVYCGSN